MDIKRIKRVELQIDLYTKEILSLGKQIATEQIENRTQRGNNSENIVPNNNEEKLQDLIEKRRLSIIELNELKKS